MRNRVLVVGGYGNVGRTVCTSLAGHFPGLIIAAGRSREKAEAFSAETQGKVLPLSLDICSPDTIRHLTPQVKLVVMCMDQQSPDFAKACLQRGIHYIDITANYPFLSHVEAFHENAQKAGATAVLSVGLAPGLTNLLARYSSSFFEQAQHADVFILLGSGEAHGEAALSWTINNISRDFAIDRHNPKKNEKGFGTKQTHFPEGLGQRTAFRFNFPEQHTLPRTLKIGSVDTWLAFDSILATWIFILSKKAGLFKLLDFQKGRQWMKGFMKKTQIGSEQYVVKVEMQGRTAGHLRRHEVSISGMGEGHATGIVAAEAAESLMTEAYPPGVFHMEQIFKLQDFLKRLNQRGLDFAFSENT